MTGLEIFYFSPVAAYFCCGRVKSPIYFVLINVDQINVRSEIYLYQIFKTKTSYWATTCGLLTK